MTVSFQVSSDGGSDFDLVVKGLTDEVGEGISSGRTKRIIWQVGVDTPEFYNANVVFLSF